MCELICTIFNINPGYNAKKCGVITVYIRSICINICVKYEIERIYHLNTKTRSLNSIRAVHISPAIAVVIVGVQ